MKSFFAGSLLAVCLLASICCGETTAQKPQDANQSLSRGKAISTSVEPMFGERSLSEIVAALNDPDLQKAIKAVNDLSCMGPQAKPAVPALVKALNQENLRESILYTLGKIGVGAEDAIPALMKAIAEYPSDCRWKAAVALANIGNGAVVSLEEGAKSEKMYLRIWCNAALAKQKGGDSPNLRYLAQAMKSSDRETAIEAVSALTMLGPVSKPLVPDFIEALEHSNVPKKDIAFALAQIGKDAKAATPELTKLAQSSDQWARRDAIYALSKIGGTDAAPSVPSLIEALKAKDKYVREQAAKALGNIGPPASAAISQLAKALKTDEDEVVRQNAAEALGKIDFTNLEAVLALIAAMKDESGRGRSAAAQELAKVGPINKEVIEAFICTTDDDWKYVTYACDEFFASLGPQHGYIMPDLMNMLKSSNVRTQTLAMTAIGNMGEAALPAVPLIVEKLKNPSSGETPFFALRKLGPYSEAAVPDLIELLGNRQQQFMAAYVLEKIGPKARRAIPALENCLGLNIKSVIFAQALLAIDPNSQKAIEELVRIAESPYVVNQWTEQPDAHYLLIIYNHDTDKHLKCLIDALHNPNSRIRLSSATHLGILGVKAKTAADPLKKAMKDENPEVRVEAAHAILTVGANESMRKEAVQMVLSSLDSNDFNTGSRASEDIRAFGSQDAWVISTLIGRMDTCQPHVRFRVIRALGNIGPGAKDALPYLRRLTVNGDWPTRCAAEKAIEKISGH